MYDSEHTVACVQRNIVVIPNALSSTLPMESSIQIHTSLYYIPCNALCGVGEGWGVEGLGVGGRSRNMTVSMISTHFSLHYRKRRSVGTVNLLAEVLSRSRRGYYNTAESAYSLGHPPQSLKYSTANRGDSQKAALLWCLWGVSRDFPREIPRFNYAAAQLGARPRP